MLEVSWGPRSLRPFKLNWWAPHFPPSDKQGWSSPMGNVSAKRKSKESVHSLAALTLKMSFSTFNVIIFFFLNKVNWTLGLLSCVFRYSDYLQAKDMRVSETHRIHPRTTRHMCVLWRDVKTLSNWWGTSPFERDDVTLTGSASKHLLANKQLPAVAPRRARGTKKTPLRSCRKRWRRDCGNAVTASPFFVASSSLEGVAGRWRAAPCCC